MLHIHEDALLELPSDNPELAGQHTPDNLQRKPLGEIAGNNGSTKDDIEVEMRNTRAAVKSRKNTQDEAEDINATSNEYISVAHAGDQSAEVIPDTHDSVPSPASEAAAADLVKDVPECKSYIVQKFDMHSWSSWLETWH
jgi:hypothetical protein